MAEIKVAKPGALTRHEALFPTFPFGGGLFSTSPFTWMRRMTEEMDRACARFMPAVTETEFWAPTLEVTEKEGNYIATLELPGLKKEEVKVEVTEEGLAISGERKLEKEEKEEGYFRSERRYGTFYRLIPLPKGAKIENVKAELNNGVLAVTVPVPEEKVAAKQIPDRLGGPAGAVPAATVGAPCVRTGADERRRRASGATGSPGAGGAGAEVPVGVIGQDRWGRTRPTSTTSGSRTRRPGISPRAWTRSPRRIRRPTRPR